MNENENEKILIFYYDQDKTTPKELQHTTSIMNRFSKYKVLFLPSSWDYEYMTKEETIARLQGMIDFVKGDTNE